MEPRGLDTTALKRATNSLANALAVLDDQRWFQVQAPGIRDTLFAGIVKNFESVYELSVKMMRRSVQMEDDVPDEVAQWGFRDMLRFVPTRGSSTCHGVVRLPEHVPSRRIPMSRTRHG